MKHFKLALALSLFFGARMLCAQTCSVHVSTLSAVAYTISSGQTLCIDSTGKFTGTITLNGGTVNNRGNFSPASFNYQSGTFNNYAFAAINSSVSLGTGNVINNYGNSILSISGNLAFGGGNLANNGIANIRGNITYTSGAFGNSGVLNCGTFGISAGSYTNTGIINKN